MRRLYISLLMLLLLGMSCKEEIQRNQFSGKWKVVEAQRDGKLTHAMDKGTIDWSDTHLSSNFLNAGKQTPYGLSNAKLTFMLGRKDVTFKMSKTHEDTLVMDGEVGFSRMVLKLVPDNDDR